MKQIKNLVDMINEELEGAKCYTDKFIDYRVSGNKAWADQYKEMAEDELKHAMYLHDQAVIFIDKMSEVQPPSEEMQDIWNSSHREYFECAETIKKMLTL